MSSIYDPERGRVMVETLVSTLETIGTTLNIPSLEAVWMATQAAAHDSSQAFHSTCRLLVLVGEPVARLLAWLLYWLGWFIYKYILVEAIYHNGLSQAKEGLIVFWNWQQSLTREQLLLEGAILVSLLGLYQLKKFLERRKYLQKAFLWINRKQRQIGKTYHAGVRRIAKVSLVLAAMTSHIIFLGAAALLRLFLPRLIAALANPKFISLFSFYCPTVCTIALLCQYKEEQQEKEQQEGEDDEHNDSTTTTTTKTPTSAVRDRRRDFATPSPTASTPSQPSSAWSLLGRLSRKRLLESPASRSMPATPGSTSKLLPSSERCLEDEMMDWLRFWMVRATVEAFKCLLSWVTPSWFVASLLQLELVFYVWIYCLPYLQPDTIAGQALPEARPLRVMCKYLGPYSKQIVDGISGAIPEDVWHNKVVGFVSQLSGALVLVRLLSQPTVDWLLHLLEESRSLVIPALTLFTPGFLTRYGVVYVQYVLSTAKSHAGRRRNLKITALWLRYWVVHVCVDAVLYHFSSILWWIPFSTHAIFCLWCYLSLPQTIDNLYGAIEEELRLFGLLPGHHDHDFEQSKTVRLLGWIWEILPKAAEEGGHKEEEQDTLSPLPKEGQQILASPKDIVKADTNTTTEEFEDEDDDDDEDGEPGTFVNIAASSPPSSEEKPPPPRRHRRDNVDEGASNDGDDDGGDFCNTNDSDDDNSDSAVIDFDFQESSSSSKQKTTRASKIPTPASRAKTRTTPASKSKATSSKGKDPPARTMMTRAQRRAEQEARRKGLSVEVVRD